MCKCCLQAIEANITKIITKIILQALNHLHFFNSYNYNSTIEQPSCDKVTIYSFWLC